MVVSSHFLLQGIFPNQESNLGLLHCRQILYKLSHQKSLWFSRRTQKRKTQTIKQQVMSTTAVQYSKRSMSKSKKILKESSLEIAGTRFSLPIFDHTKALSSLAENCQDAHKMSLHRKTYLSLRIQDLRKTDHVDTYCYATSHSN